MLRLSGKLIWRGMSVDDAFKALKLSGKWEYIASGDGWFWVRSFRNGDVVEFSCAGGKIVDVDIL